jgi:hypothetical protein
VSFFAGLQDLHNFQVLVIWHPLMTQIRHTNSDHNPFNYSDWSSALAYTFRPVIKTSELQHITTSIPKPAKHLFKTKNKPIITKSAWHLPKYHCKWTVSHNLKRKRCAKK